VFILPLSFLLSFLIMSLILRPFLLNILKPLQRVKTHLKRQIQFCKTQRIWALQPPELVAYVEGLESQLRDIERSVYDIQLELEVNSIRGRF